MIFGNNDGFDDGDDDYVNDENDDSNNQVYNLSKLTDWRTAYGIGKFTEIDLCTENLLENTKHLHKIHWNTLKLNTRWLFIIIVIMMILMIMIFIENLKNKI